MSVVHSIFLQVFIDGLIRKSQAFFYNGGSPFFLPIVLAEIVQSAVYNEDTQVSLVTKVSRLPYSSVPRDILLFAARTLCSSQLLLLRLMTTQFFQGFGQQHCEKNDVLLDSGLLKFVKPVCSPVESLAAW